MRKRLFRSRSGEGYPMVIAVTLCLLMLFLVIAEYFRVNIIVQGVRDAVQQAVIATVNENYDDVYHSVREGYAAGWPRAGVEACAPGRACGAWPGRAAVRPWIARRPWRSQLHPHRHLHQHQTVQRPGRARQPVRLVLPAGVGTGPANAAPVPLAVQQVATVGDHTLAPAPLVLVQQVGVHSADCQSR